MKAGSRKSAIKTKKNIMHQISNYQKHFEYYGTVAQELSKKYNNIDDENIQEILDSEGFKNIDEMGKFLILGQIKRTYERED